jgi:hypothetical protein
VGDPGRPSVAGGALDPGPQREPAANLDRQRHPRAADDHAGAGLAQCAREWCREGPGRHQRSGLRRVADLPSQHLGIEPEPVPACGLLGAGRIPKDKSRQHGAGEPSGHSAPLPLQYE